MRIRHKASQELKDKAALKSDTVFQTLQSKTPQEAADYVDANVTDLASAKQMLKVFAKVIVVLAKKV